MATLLDVGLLQNFSVIFTFLLIMTLTYGVLEMTKLLGKNKNLHAMIALCMAVFLSFSSKPQAIISGIIPWFVLTFVFIMFLLMATRFMFGEAGDEILMKVMGGEQAAGAWVVIIAIIILLVTMGTVVGPEVTPGVNGTSIQVDPGEGGSTQTGDWQTNVLNTLYHPKVLGTVVLLMIALFAIKLLSAAPQ